MRRYPVKENPIGSAVSEILGYKQTDRQTNKQTDIVILCIIDDESTKFKPDIMFDVGRFPFLKSNIKY